MRVCIDARRATWNGSSGVGTYASSLVRDIRRLPGAESSLRVLTRSRLVDMSSPSPHAGARVLRWAGKSVSDFLEVPVAARGCDVLHALYVEGPANSRSVVTVHDLVVLDRDLRSGSGRYYAWRTKAAVRRAGAVICPSETVARDVRDVLGRDAGVNVVHLGTDAPPVDSDSAARSESRRRYFVYSGGANARKNLGVLRQAWQRAHRAGCELLVTGGTPWEDPDAGIRYVGRLARSDLWRLYSEAVGIVYPSLEEGFGLPVVEGVALAKPVVCGPVGIVPELPEGAVILVDQRSPAEVETGILRALDGWTPVESAVTAVREHFTWSRCAAETWRVYREVAGR